MLPKKRRTGTYWWIAIGTVGVLLVIWQFYKYGLVNRKVDQAVTEKTKGLYSIRYNGLVVDEVGGALHVKNIEITPDTAVYNQLVKENKNPPVLLKLFVPALDITGVKTPKALLAKEIEAGKIEILNPTIEILIKSSGKDARANHAGTADPAVVISRELLRKILKIKIDSAKIINANVTVSNVSTKQTIKGNNVSFVLSNLLIDSTANKDSSRILFSRDLVVKCDDLLLPLKNKKYRTHIKDVRFTSRDETLFIGQLRLTPQLPEVEFAASFPTQKDRYDFTLEGIRLKHINRSGLWNNNIEADSLIINRSSFKIYRDLSYPRDGISRVGKYPQQQLVKLHMPMNIQKVVFEHSFIEYKERNAKSDSAGKLQFFDVHATISNLTNIKEAIGRNRECTLLFEAKLLNKAPLKAKLVMLLKDPKGRFSIEGNIGDIDAPSLNPITQPMGLARMEKGHVDRLSFNFKGNDSLCEGKLLFLYDGVKISLLKKDEEEKKLNKKKLASLFANVIMKNSNPSNGSEPRTVEVHFQRLLDRSFFNLVWKSIFTGIKETAGMK